MGEKTVPRKILITGAGGFVGRNLVCELERFPEEYELLKVDVDTDEETFVSYISGCDFVVHLAGVNRPKNEAEFAEGNADLTTWLTNKLCESGNIAPVAMTSSIQAALDNPYGASKAAAENALLAYGASQGVPVYIWRLPNVFGKWCRPNYNSAVATFCHNIARGLPVTVNDPERVMELIYIDDVISLIKGAINGEATAPDNSGLRSCGEVSRCLLREIPEKLTAFRDSRATLMMPDIEYKLDRELYATYLSYLPEEEFAYELTAHSDARGAFAEIIKSRAAGQISFSTTAPGVTRGNHWHHTKNEKFVVISGEAVVRFRKIDGQDVISYEVSGERPTVVDIPPGYTHSITNTSKTETMIMMIWASEPFDPERPDTYYLEV